MLVEAGPDVGAGTSKANTAILHTGFDAKPGTLESALVPAGYELLSAYATRVGIPTATPGALMVAWNDEQLDALPGIKATAAANGCHDARAVAVEELYRERAFPGARGAGSIAGPRGGNRVPVHGNPGVRHRGRARRLPARALRPGS